MLLTIFGKIPIIKISHWTLRAYSKPSESFNPLSDNFTKWSNTFKQFVGKLPTNCLSVFDHFVGLALKGLRWKRVQRFKPSTVFCKNLRCLTEFWVLLSFEFSACFLKFVIGFVMKELYFERHVDNGYILHRVCICVHCFVMLSTISNY